jgi:hypothetical protein
MLNIVIDVDDTDTCFELFCFTDAGFIPNFVATVFTGLTRVKESGPVQVAKTVLTGAVLTSESAEYFDVQIALCIILYLETFLVSSTRCQ